jgi:hypothetical protein
VEPVNPQPLPLRARPRKRRREDGRNEPGGDSRRRRVSGDRGSQPRHAVQAGRPTTAPTRAAEAQARGQRAEHQPARPSAVLAPSRVQRRGVEARRVVAPCVGARSVSDEPGTVPSGASAPRGIRRPRHGRAIVGNTFERRPERTTILRSLRELRMASHVVPTFRTKSSKARETRLVDAIQEARTRIVNRIGDSSKPEDAHPRPLPLARSATLYPDGRNLPPQEPRRQRRHGSCSCPSDPTRPAATALTRRATGARPHAVHACGVASSASVPPLRVGTPASIPTPARVSAVRRNVPPHSLAAGAARARGGKKAVGCRSLACGEFLPSGLREGGPRRAKRMRIGRNATLQLPHPPPQERKNAPAFCLALRSQSAWPRHAQPSRFTAP